MSKAIKNIVNKYTAIVAPIIGCIKYPKAHSVMKISISYLKNSSIFIGNIISNLYKLYTNELAVKSRS